MKERRALTDEALRDTLPGETPNITNRQALDLTPAIQAEGEGKWWGNPDFWGGLEDISVAVHDARRASRSREKELEIHNDTINGMQQNFLIEQTAKYRADTLVNDIKNTNMAQLEDDLDLARINPNLMQKDVLDRYYADREKEAGEYYNNGNYYIANKLAAEASSVYNTKIGTVISNDRDKSQKNYSEMNQAGYLAREVKEGATGDVTTNGFLNRFNDYGSRIASESLQSGVEIENDLNVSFNKGQHVGVDSIIARVGTGEITPEEAQNVIMERFANSSFTINTLSPLTGVELSKFKANQGTTQGMDGQNYKVQWKTKQQLLDWDAQHGTNTFSYIDPSTGKRVANESMFSMLDEQLDEINAYRESHEASLLQADGLFLPTISQGENDILPNISISNGEALYPVMEKNFVVSSTPETQAYMISKVHYLEGLKKKDPESVFIMDSILTLSKADKDFDAESFCNGDYVRVPGSHALTDMQSAIAVASRTGKHSDWEKVFKIVTNATIPKFVYDYLVGFLDYNLTSGGTVPLGFASSELRSLINVLDQYALSPDKIPDYIPELVLGSGTPYAVDLNNIFYSGMIPKTGQGSALDTETIDNYKRYYIAQLRDNLRKLAAYADSHAEALSATVPSVKQEINKLATYSVNSFIVSDENKELHLNMDKAEEYTKALYEANKRNALMSSNGNSVTIYNNERKKLRADALKTNDIIQQSIVAQASAMSNKNALGFMSFSSSELDKPSTYDSMYFLNCFVNDESQLHNFYDHLRQTKGEDRFSTTKTLNDLQKNFKGSAEEKRLPKGNAENFVGYVYDKMIKEVNPEYHKMLSGAITLYVRTELSSTDAKGEPRKISQGEIDNFFSQFQNKHYGPTLRFYPQGAPGSGQMTYLNGFADKQHQAEIKSAYNKIALGSSANNYTLDSSADTYTLDWDLGNGRQKVIVKDATGKTIALKRSDGTMKNFEWTTDFGTVPPNQRTKMLGYGTGATIAVLNFNNAINNDSTGVLKKIVSTIAKDNVKAGLKKSDAKALLSIGNKIKGDTIRVMDSLNNSDFQKQIMEDIQAGKHKNYQPSTYGKYIAGHMNKEREQVIAGMTYGDSAKVSALMPLMEELNDSSDALTYIIDQAILRSASKNKIDATTNKNAVNTSINTDPSNSTSTLRGGIRVFGQQPNITVNNARTWRGGIVTQSGLDHQKRYHGKYGKDFSYMAIDVSYPRGTKLKGWNTGEVLFAGNTGGGAGNNVITLLGNGYMLERTMHMDKLLVSAGKKIYGGVTEIGTAGRTGEVRGGSSKEGIGHYETIMIVPGPSTLAEEMPYLKQGNIRFTVPDPKNPKRQIPGIFVMVDPNSRKDKDGRVRGPLDNTKEAEKNYKRTLKYKASADLPKVAAEDTVDPKIALKDPIIKATNAAMVQDVKRMGFFLTPNEAQFLQENNLAYKPSEKDLEMVGMEGINNDDYTKKQGILAARYAMGKEVLRQTNTRDYNFLAMAATFKDTLLKFETYEGEDLLTKQTLNDIIALGRTGDLYDLPLDDGEWVIEKIDKKTKKLVFS